LISVGDPEVYPKRRIPMFLGLPDPNSDPLVGDIDPDPDPSLF